jgi:hypothetical protein
MKKKTAVKAKSPAKKAPGRVAAAIAAGPSNPNPTGKCTWVNSAGQLQCRDGITKAACSKLSPGAVFTPGGSCL